MMVKRGVEDQMIGMKQAGEDKGAHFPADGDAVDDLQKAGDRDQKMRHNKRGELHPRRLIPHPRRYGRPIPPYPLGAPPIPPA